MTAATPALVFCYRRTGKFAVHALVASLEVDPELQDTPIDLPDTRDGLVAAIRSRLQHPAPVVVGWSFYTADFGRMVAELAAVRAAVDDPRVRHLAGGVHASAEPLATLQAGFDLVARGEGELLIRDLVRTLRAGGDPRDVAGIASLVDGELRSTPRADLIDLDEFPPCALQHGRFGPIEITRGCIYACRFCQTPYFSKARFRHRSVDNVCTWAEQLCGRGFQDFRFLTPTSLSYGSDGPEPNLAAVEELLRRMRSTIGPQRRLFFGTFPSEVRPEHVTAEALALLHRYVDNRTLILGGQSGSDQVLARSARGHDVAAIERAVTLAVAAGFEPHVDFLFGLPGETTADARRSLELARRLTAAGARAHGHTFMPLPGTPFRDQPRGSYSPEIRRELERLASQGRLYGQWQRQAEPPPAAGTGEVPRPGSG
jgi:B12-binding domain/radical SAM domain protein